MKRLKKRFKLPEYCDIAEFVMRELDANDEMEAAMWAEQKMTSAHRENPIAAMGLEQREAVRLSLCEVEGAKVNHDGVPYAAMDNFSMRTMRFLNSAFSDLNGIDSDDLKNFQAEASLILDEPEKSNDENQ